MKQVVAALIVRDDTILICQRTKYQPMPLQWEFPGGKIEPGENAVEALVRELQEELALPRKSATKSRTSCTVTKTETSSNLDSIWWRNTRARWRTVFFATFVG